MAELKTKPNDQSVENFLNGIADEKKRQDSFTLLALMQEVTQMPAIMWGDGIIGFGSYHYKYESGREGEWFQVGFSPRKQNLTLYILHGFEGYPELMKRLGKYKTGKSCLYINKTEDINLSILRQLVKQSVANLGQMTL